MMFLQYFIWGAWFVTLGTFLGKGLSFEGGAIGWCYSTLPIAAMIAPIFVGMIADRFFPAERILCFLHVVGGGLLYYASTQNSFPTMFGSLIVYALFYMPTLALTNSLAFQQMRDPAQQFPGIRIWGTIGWIAAGNVIDVLFVQGASLPTLATTAPEGMVGIQATQWPMRIAAGVSVLQGAFCLFLPHTPPSKTGPASFGDILGLRALALMKEPSFAVFVIGSFLICIPLQFYYMFTNPFLTEVGMPAPTSKMTFGQMSEIFFMLVMPFFFAKLGVKRMLIVGMAAWALRYFLFSSGAMWMLYIGIILHGICYDFFFVTGQIYIDHKAPKDIRSAAQGFIALVTLGAGGFVGSVVGGKTLDLYKLAAPVGSVTYDWQGFWMIPSIGAIVVLVLFALFFHDRQNITEQEVRKASGSAEGPVPQVG